VSCRRRPASKPTSPCINADCGCEAVPTAALIPAAVGHAYHARVAACDGTWMAPSVLHVAATGAWKASEMARDPGGSLQPFPAERQQWRRAGDRPKGSRPTAKLSLSRTDAKACSGTQIAERGCRKATPGTVRSLRTRKGPPRRSHGLLGPQGPAVVEKAPAYPSHPSRGAAG
jgi:hypothetical protein